MLGAVLYTPDYIQHRQMLLITQKDHIRKAKRRSRSITPRNHHPWSMVMKLPCEHCHKQEPALFSYDLFESGYTSISSRSYRNEKLQHDFHKFENICVICYGYRSRGWHYYYHARQTPEFSY